MLHTIKCHNRGHFDKTRNFLRRKCEAMHVDKDTLKITISNPNESIKALLESPSLIV